MLVSVIIPCYNVEHYIRACVESVLSQNHTDLEIICVDNNSTDDTASVLKEIAHAHPDKIILTTCAMQGAPAARNAGIAIAKGDWLQFLDADDTLLPKKIAHQLALLNRGEATDVVIGAYQKNFSDGTNKTIHVKNDNPWKALVSASAGCTCSNLYRKNAVIAAGSWDETKKSSQEAYLLFNLLKRGSILLYDFEAFTVINERSSGSISAGSPTQNWERYLALRIEILTYLQRNQPQNTEAITAAKQAIFDTVRIIYQIAPETAISLYNEHVKGNFHPLPSAATGKKYIRILSLLGFPFAEKLTRSLKKITA